MSLIGFRIRIIIFTISITNITSFRIFLVVVAAIAITIVFVKKTMDFFVNRMQKLYLNAQQKKLKCAQCFLEERRRIYNFSCCCCSNRALMLLEAICTGGKN